MYKEIIESLLSKKWHYLADKELLVLRIATKKQLAELGLLDDEGYLDEAFKQQFTARLKALGFLEGTVGPFGDEDYFSGIEEDNELNYFVEIHNATQSLVDSLSIKL